MKTELPLVSREKGFSLVELMVVVAIIGVLAAIGVPRFRVFQAKARQAEAKANLANIYTLEQAYQGDNDTFAALPAGIAPAGAAGPCPAVGVANPIGFIIADCSKIRYTYTTTAAAATTFTAQAASGVGAANKIWPGCATADTWTINEASTITAVSDTTKGACNQ